MNYPNKSEQQTLEALSKADRFNRWMYETIKPWCRGKVLEIGSGIGNISSFFVQDNFDITLSDCDDYYLQTLRDKFTGASNVKNIIFLDLQEDNFHKTHANLADKFDTIFMLNVLEHIEDDNKALNNCRMLLKTGGTLIILVPAHSWLYSKLDKKLHHYRRYTLSVLRYLFDKHQFTMKKQFYFNSMGIAAWLYAKVVRLAVVPTGGMKMYNKLVPVGKAIDKLFAWKIGLSAVMIGEK